MNLLIYCWIWFANTLLRIFASLCSSMILPFNFLYLWYLWFWCQQPHLILKLGHNCFTVLCQFLPYSTVHQPYAHECPLPPEPPSYPTSHPSRSSQRTELSCLCGASFPPAPFYPWRVHVSMLLSQSVPPSPPPPPPCTQVRSLCQRLHSCPADRLRSTILLDSVCMP